MNEPSSFLVSSAAEAAKVLDYFNAFHDGFMKRVNIISGDEINEDCSRRLRSGSAELHRIV